MAAMKIVSYFVNDSDAQVGDRTSVFYGESGWRDVLTFQRDRLSYFKTHPRERADLTPAGLNIVQRASRMGLRRVQEVTIGGEKES